MLLSSYKLERACSKQMNGCKQPAKDLDAQADRSKINGQKFALQRHGP